MDGGNNMKKLNFKIIAGGMLISIMLKIIMAFLYNYNYKMYEIGILIIMPPIMIISTIMIAKLVIKVIKTIIKTTKNKIKSITH